MAKLRFIVSLITKDNDYQVEQAASAQAAAQKLGVDLQILYADNDAITQSTQLLKTIQADASERPQAILFEPVGGTAFPQVAQAAVSAKIAWGALNREADYLPQLRKTAQVPVFTVTSDHQEIGRIQGRQFTALLPKGGTVLYIQGPTETSAARDRTAGMQLTLAHNIQVISLRGRWTEESAQRAVESWLRLNTSNKIRIDVVSAQNDLMAIGARKAFEGVSNLIDRERWLRTPCTGVDGLSKTGLAWVRTGLLTATVLVPTNAGQAVSMMAEALQTGKDVPERTFTVPESFPSIEKLATACEKVAPTL
ncbi:MAG TPA: sugar ABC transporter substrate-binding protein [Candidatus Acidoferrum sp.]|nr:sugar ABC transporter substrate-binding protein [Candidatus Acidoferrum sp.]